MRKNFESKMISSVLWILFFASLALFGFQITFGSKTLNIFQFQISTLEIAFAIRIDPLSCLMFAMVSLLSAVVGQYALRYLDGESRQGYFYKFLLTTVLFVVLLVLSSNLVMFFIAWFGMSWGLNRLLLYHSNRPAAVYAARKKFLVSRLGDVAVLGAIGLIYHIFGTFEFAEIFSQVETGTSTQNDQAVFSIAAILLAAGAMTKSAQVPFHFWLPETMETPTPVSALMHAGIINAGGFLVLRLSPLISHSIFASAMLATCGALTAIYGALVMSTQNNIKTKLAYSTISQMGMMMFACGIHAYSFALFHIIAHSFYKAYAFLTTGTLVEERKHHNLEFSHLGLGFIFTAIIAVFSIVFFANFWKSGLYLPNATYISVILLGLLQAGKVNHPPKHFYLIACATIVISVGIYTALENVVSSFVSIQEASEPRLVVNCFALTIFASGLLLSRFLMESQTKMSQMLYMFIWNGGYFGVRTNRILSRIWSA
jgi:NAD(P)H-quinone oxidoreductase subunit 5